MDDRKNNPRPMITRSALEAALDELIVNQRGVDFQRIAVPLARKRCPALVASEISKDGGEDAYLIGQLSDGSALSVASSITANPRKIGDDVGAIKRRKPRLKNVWFYTPGVHSTRKVDGWKAEVKQKFEVDLEVITREEIVGQLLDPRFHYLAYHHLGFSHPAGDSVTRARELLAQGAAQRLDQWLTLRVDRRIQPVPRDYAIDDGENATMVGLSGAEVAGTFIGGGLFVLWGEAGVGKSVALGQLAQAYSEGPTRPLALLISAPAWARSGQELPQFLSRQFLGEAEPFAGSVMSLLQAGEIGVFVNGWNEVAPDERAELTEHLTNFLHASPGCPVILATRTVAGLAALTPAAYYRVQGLSDIARGTIAKQLAPEMFDTLQALLDRDSGVDTLSRLPLFLIPLVDAFLRGENMPASRHALLETALRAMEHSPDHAASWSVPTVVADVRPALGRIAYELSTRGTTEAPRSEVIAWLERVPLDSASMPTANFLERLIQHHVLERDGDETIRFQHEYFQDWLCAQYLRTQSMRSETTDTTLAQWLDNRRLGAALDLMVAALMDNPQDSAVRDLAERLFRWAVEVDLQLAARWLPQLAHAISSTWVEEWKSRIRGLLRQGDAARKMALVAVLTAGVPDFAEEIWRILDPSQTPRGREWLRSLPPRVPVEALGPQWRSRIAWWPPEQRADFVTQWARVATHDDSLALLKDFAQRDPAALVRAECIHTISFYDPVSAAALFSTADAECRGMLLELGAWNETPPELTAPYLSELETLASFPVTTPRAQAALYYLAEHHPDKVVGTYRGELERAVADSPDYNRILEFLARHDRRWTGAWVQQALALGKRVPDSAFELLREVEDSTALLQLVDDLIASSTDPIRGRGHELARLVRLDIPEIVERCFAEWLRARRARAEGEPRNAALEVHVGEVEGAMRSAAVGLLLPLLDRHATDFAGAAGTEEVARVLTGALENDGRAEATGADYSARLRMTVQRLVSAAFAAEDPSGSCKDAVARLTRETGDPALRESLDRLCEAERARALASRVLPPIPPPYNARIYYSRETTYVTALRKLAGAEAIDALLLLLETEPFELAAAGQLLEILMDRAGRRTGPPPTQTDWAAIARIHQEVSTAVSTEDEQKVAAALARRIAYWKRTMLDPPDRMKLQTLVASEVIRARLVRSVDVEIVMAYPINPHSIHTVVGWVEDLVKAGALVPSVWVDRILTFLLSSPEVTWMRDDEKSRLVRQCLTGLMFSDNPMLATKRIHEVLADGGAHWLNLSDLLDPIAVSGIPDQSGLLLALMPNRTHGTYWWRWATALSHLPASKQYELVTSLIAAGISSSLIEALMTGTVHAPLGPILARIVENNSTLRAAVEATAADRESPAQPFAITILTFIADLRAAEHLLSIAISDRELLPHLVRRALIGARWDRMEASRSPSGVATQAITPLRQTLLGLTVNADASLRQWAIDLLLEMEAVAEGDFPPNEPRHPDLASGIQWPPSASQPLNIRRSGPTHE